MQRRLAAMRLCWRRTFVWRYVAMFCFIVSFVGFLSMPKSLHDDAALFTDLSTNTVHGGDPLLATRIVRNYSATVAAKTDQQLPGGGIRPPSDELRPTKKPSALDELHKNMTLHKANMSDLLMHVKAAAAVINSSHLDDHTGPPRKVLNPHPFKYIINSSDICADRDIYVIAYVHTAPDHYKRRVVIRQTWGDPSNYDVKLRVIFVMGRTSPADGNSSTGVQRALEFEAEQYGDIVQEDFLDTYRNLTYKGIASLKWISERCSHARYVLKTDDDIFVNTFNLLRHLRRLDRIEAGGGQSTRGMLLCLVWYTMLVMREGKWKVNPEEWPDKFYPTYCSGSAFVMSTDVAVAMHRISYDVPFFWVDDFYVTGLLPLKLGKTAVRHEQFMWAYVLNGLELEQKFTGPQWYQYVFSHVHNLNAIQAVWKTVVKLARGEFVPKIAFALPGQLPKVNAIAPKTR